MSTVLEQVQLQISLACSNDNENEARNAAIKACKLIKKHNLTLSEPLPHSAPNFQSPPRTAPRADAIGNFIRDVATEAASRIKVKDVVDIALASAKRGR